MLVKYIYLCNDHFERRMYDLNTIHNQRKEYMELHKMYPNIKMVAVVEYIGSVDKNKSPIFDGDILVTSNQQDEQLFDEMCDEWGREEYPESIAKFNPYTLQTEFSEWNINNYDNDVFSEKYITIIDNIYEREILCQDQNKDKNN